MFKELFRFELSYRLRRPAFYLYFFSVLIWTAFSFAKGWVPHQDKQLLNSPATLAMFTSALSLFLMMMSCFFLGVTLYRDLEHGTKEYYLSYPITKPGYFWGRFCGAFLLVASTGAAAVLGAWLGSLIGPAMHLQSAEQYGPNTLVYYLAPYLTIMLPNLFFTSTLFFGLISVFRNVKALYAGAMFLFMGYLISNFFLHNIHNPRVIFLADPFTFNGLRMQFGEVPVSQLNTSPVRLEGLFLENRILWASISLVIVLATYWRFSFQRFFSPVGARKASSSAANKPSKLPDPLSLSIGFRPPYNREVLANLIKIELLNIIRDAYFWIILTGGVVFLTFGFLHGPGAYGVSDYPRTVFIVDVFEDNLMIFLFFLLLFYTGETVHREKLTRYNLINDTLPPATWVLNLAKLVSLLIIAFALALTPVWLGLIVQIIDRAPDFNLSQYLSSEFVRIIPRMFEIGLLCYTAHIALDNKFLAHAVAIVFYIGSIMLSEFHFLEYLPLLYAQSPWAWASDMDGLGHMVKPTLWFQLYWMLAGSVLVLTGSLFYARGTRTSMREKFRLARERFHGSARWGLIAVFIVFLVVAGYVYYNISYRNEYLTLWERRERSALTEKALKKYAGLPLPKLISARMEVALMPDIQRSETHAWCTIQNRSKTQIDSLLLDADGLEFEVLEHGAHVPYTTPLYFTHGKFSFLRTDRAASDYRVYHLPQPLLPGDTMQLEIKSTQSFDGFQNGFYAGNLLQNGTMTGGGLPGMGYDDDEELSNDDVRKEHGLKEKEWVSYEPGDSVGRSELRSHFNADLLTTDITVSTAADQWVVAPGILQREWKENNRHYFHYVQDHPQVYMPFAMFSARYAIDRDTVRLNGGKTVPVAIYYNPGKDQNLSHFMAGIKDGLNYCSAELQNYPFQTLSFTETNAYGPFSSSLPGLIGMAEPRSGWAADMRDNRMPDYPYFHAVEQIARQWWTQQVVPNNTKGSAVISDAIPKYIALRLLTRKTGRQNAAQIYNETKWEYGWARSMAFEGEAPLINCGRSNISAQKGTLVLYGLAEMMGEDSVDAALRDFLHQWSFRNGGPYPGAPDLYAALKAHTPDSLQYYIQDGWESVTLYDNRILAVDATHSKDDSLYHLKIQVSIGKVRVDPKTGEHPVTNMNDLIDIGIFTDDNGNSTSKPGISTGKHDTPTNWPRLLQLYSTRMTAGEHTIQFTVRQKPTFVQIDPNGKLLTIRDGGNRKSITDIQ